MEYSENFIKCVKVILANEGGYVYNSFDSGGETNFGISKRAFPNEDIKRMTIERATEIYYTRYWSLMHLDDITDINKALQLFDFAINVGVGRAVKKAQALVLEEQDGLIGPKTIQAINEDLNFVEDYKLIRIYYYNQLIKDHPKMDIFLKGWERRVRETKIN